ncbi:hypothetical protein D3C86_1000060 [compost metagenome]
MVFVFFISYQQGIVDLVVSYFSRNAGVWQVDLRIFDIVNNQAVNQRVFIGLDIKLAVSDGIGSVDYFRNLSVYGNAIAFAVVSSGNFNRRNAGELRY